MFAMSRRCLMLVISIALLAGCGSPTPPPTPTVVPTEPATSTPMPPTATAVPTNTPTLAPTNTPSPTATPLPTITPAPTATPLPTNTPKPAPTKAVTPMPTNTKAAAAPVSSGGGVSSKPSTLEKSIEQSFNTAQVIIGLLDQMIAGGGGELCAPLIEKYQSVHSAPTYDMTGQSNEARQAYDAYRNGIRLLDSRADLILGCGQTGGPIDTLNLGLIHNPAGHAVNSFAQALETLKLAPGMSTLSPLESAIVRTLHSVDGMNNIVNQLISGKGRGGPSQIKAGDTFCTQLVAYHNAIQNFTMDPADQSPSTQEAYRLYQEALAHYETDVSSFPKTCIAGEVTVSTTSMGNLKKLIVNVLNQLYQAQAVLK
jgi:hypothetical protein